MSTYLCDKCPFHCRLFTMITIESPVIVHRSLSRLVCSGRVADRAGRLEITRDGMRSLYREARV